MMLLIVMLSERKLSNYIFASISFCLKFNTYGEVIYLVSVFPFLIILLPVINQLQSRVCIVDLPVVCFCSYLQELDIIYRIPHCVPISAHHKWNFDDLLEKMWNYLLLVRL